MRTGGWIALAMLVVGTLSLFSARSEPASNLEPEHRDARPAAQAAQHALEIAVEDDAAPWSQADGSGYANDVVRAAFHAVGVDVRLSVVPYARCKQMVVEGQVAACFAMSRGRELTDSVVFPEQPLFVCQAELLLRHDDARQLTRAEQLPNGSVVGVVLGYEYPEVLYALERAGTISLEASRSEELNLRKLAEGRVDAAVLNHNAIKPLSYVLARAGVEGRVRHGSLLGDLSSYVGFSRRHPRGLDARLRFDEGLRSIEQSGEKSRIDALWAARIAAETARITKERTGGKAHRSPTP
jgi:ABC-type amino acid transport substrate-binding protein